MYYIYTYRNLLCDKLLSLYEYTKRSLIIYITYKYLGNYILSNDIC